ncbi:hypothetical protein BO70DRAFT_419885 [Aspergillus heteromorphus CBS 117.55]|uniref:Uncharacterized protein n=1 Tax=Aspergillus heteromorphus CBS 117.55 TaxID=1448321 RepID=A0A317WTI6_9EURO|nr:uncharacterized protein BO70DRAFT_419885 [Aspergillus heteromorphus CBS 117.55]PWY88248.1 hypothetical protein BO70DRAFT_419885 [Aspergillus heteromorphus CBS 117.55]
MQGDIADTVDIDISVLDMVDRCYGPVDKDGQSAKLLVMRIRLCDIYSTTANRILYHVTSHQPYAEKGTTGYDMTGQSDHQDGGKLPTHSLSIYRVLDMMCLSTSTSHPIHHYYPEYEDIEKDRPIVMIDKNEPFLRQVDPYIHIPIDVNARPYNLDNKFKGEYLAKPFIRKHDPIKKMPGSENRRPRKGSSSVYIVHPTD